MPRRLRRLCPGLGQARADNAFAQWRPTLALVGPYACHVFLRFPLAPGLRTLACIRRKARRGASLDALGLPTISLTSLNARACGFP